MAGSFAIGLVVYGTIAFVLAIPLFVSARRRARHAAFRGFVYGGVGVAVACALLAAGTHELRGACDEAGYNLSYACLDVGAAGLQLLLVGGYAVAAWITAYFIAKD